MDQTIIGNTSHQNERHRFKHILPTLWTLLLSLRSTRIGQRPEPPMPPSPGHGSHTMPAYDMLVPSDVGGSAYSYCDEL